MVQDLLRRQWPEIFQHALEVSLSILPGMPCNSKMLPVIPQLCSTCGLAFRMFWGLGLGFMGFLGSGFPVSQAGRLRSRSEALCDGLEALRHRRDWDSSVSSLLRKVLWMVF